MASMLAFGVVVGLLFPPFARLVLDSSAALSPLFFGLCVGAGLLVGAANYGLFAVVVSRNLERIAGRMKHVVDRVERHESGEDACLDGCLIEQTSADAIGDMECAFNDLATAVAHRVGIDATLSRCLDRITESVEFRRVTDALLEASRDCCRAPAGALYVSDGFGFTLAAHRGLDATEELPTALDARQGVASRVIESGRVELATEHGLGWFTLSTPFGTLRPRNVVILPFRAESRTVGVGFLALESDRLDRRSRELLEALGARGGPPLQNAMLHDKLSELAAIDELTGLLNRRFGVRRLREEYSRSIRHGVPLSVLMVDVDHFKQLNDVHGHDAGDEVLRVVGDALNKMIRAGDVACRYGGEEFLVVVPGTGMDDAGEMANRIRREIETMEVHHAGKALQVTMSLGVATWPVVACSTPEELVTAADEALYHAKRSGRNVVAVQKMPRPVVLSELGDARPSQIEELEQPHHAEVTMPS